MIPKSGGETGVILRAFPIVQPYIYISLLQAQDFFAGHLR